MRSTWSEEGPGSDVSLELQALPVTQSVWDEMSKEDKSIIEGGACKVVKLWSIPAKYHAPSEEMGLRTTPGICSRDIGDVMDPVLRGFYNNAIDMARRDGLQESAQGWQDYLAKPSRIFAPPGTYGFVIPAALNVPTGKMRFDLRSGNQFHPADDRNTITILKGKHKGVTFERRQR